MHVGNGNDFLVIFIPLIYIKTQFVQISTNVLAVPVYNGGTCNNLVNGFTCDCSGGYEGTTCKSGKLYSHYIPIPINLLCKAKSSKRLQVAHQEIKHQE